MYFKLRHFQPIQCIGRDRRLYCEYIESQFRMSYGNHLWHGFGFQYTHIAPSELSTIHNFRGAHSVSSHVGFQISSIKISCRGRGKLF